MRQRLIFLSKVSLLVVFSGLALILLLTLQTDPSVPQAEILTPSEITRIEQLVVNNAPQNVSVAELRQIGLSNDELNLMIRYANEALGPEPALNGQVRLEGTSIITSVSIPMVSAPLPLYLNLVAEFVNSNAPYQDNFGNLQLVSVHAGRLAIPPGLANIFSPWIQRRYLGNNQAYATISDLQDSVRNVDVSDSQLLVEFQWEPALLNNLRDQAQRLFVSEQDQLRIARHFTVLAGVVNAIEETTRAITLTTLLQPMFQAAQIQTRRDRNPIAENRTLLITLAAYVNQDNIAQWLNPDLVTQIPNARVIEVRVQRRQDLAQHITSSAAIAASAGARLALIISSTKEAYDARYRSGFSFSDITANTAGVAIGRLATDSVVNAEQLQQRMIDLQGDSDFLPAVGSSRDGISESDFNIQYRDSNSSDYLARVDEIESVLFELPLYSGLVID